MLSFTGSPRLSISLAWMNTRFVAAWKAHCRRKVSAAPGLRQRKADRGWVEVAQRMQASG
jgi:hypothetical protein